MRPAIEDSWQQAVVDGLKANQIRIIAQVADSVLAPIITMMEDDPFFRVITLSREEEGIGVLTGAYLGGMRGALLLQSSGLGNTINALGSLALPYQIPFPILLSQRGDFHEHNVVQLAGGKAATEILHTLGIQSFDVSEPDEVRYVVEHGAHHAFVTRRPVAIILTTRMSGGKRGGTR